MGQVSDLHELLLTMGTSNVYHQPPSYGMKYPAILYVRDSIENTSADDITYKQEQRYKITVIDEDPDSPIVYNVSLIPRCKYNRNYIADGLNHDVFILTY